MSEEKKEIAEEATSGPASRLTLRDRIHEVIFGTETYGGRGFDLVLLFIILASVVVVCLQTVYSIDARYGDLLWKLEWAFTIFFTVEYLLRLYCVKKPWKYATSFFGIIDLLSFLPNYIVLFLVGNAPSFAVIRALRLLRVFRIMNLRWFMSEAEDLGKAVVKAQAKIVVFLGVVLVAVTMAGTLMYEVENWNKSNWIPSAMSGSVSGGGTKTDEEREKLEKYRLQLLDNDLTVDDLREPDPRRVQLIEELKADIEADGLDVDDLNVVTSKFTSIPQSMYWAIVTMTTVGYGDIVPTTVVGKFLAAVLILLGYSLIIVPTGFVSAEIMQARQAGKPVHVVQRACPHCMAEGHQKEAIHCFMCGEKLNPLE
ncbi:MAG: ion transporter [Planctomycetota bacterium]